MNKDIIDLFVSQGIFAILFGYLLLYVLKENRNRESKYQELLHELTDLLLEIKQDISSIKETLKS